MRRSGSQVEFVTDGQGVVARLEMEDDGTGHTDQELPIGMFMGPVPNMRTVRPFGHRVARFLPRGASPLGEIVMVHVRNLPHRCPP